MDDGITEEIQAFDHSYLIQTEIVGEGARTVRTSVFDSGRVIAIREVEIEPSRPLRDAMEAHHRRVVGGLRARDEAGLETEPPTGSDADLPHPGSRVERPARAEVAEITAPPVPEEPALVDGLRVRQLYGDLRRRLRSSASEGEAERLASAEGTLRWIVTHPLFPKIRLDEQLRFHRLLDRLAPGSDSDCPVQWSEVTDFAAYLKLINHRADLVSFDRELLQWLATSIEIRGVGPVTLTPMRWIFGRDEAIDELLEEVATTESSVWLDEIERARSSLRDG